MADPPTVPVLFPLALDAAYDYRMPDGVTLAAGDFVVAPLGPRERLGVVWSAEGERKPVETTRLRPISERLDDIPPLPPQSLAFAEWVARYTLSPLGMVLRMMLSTSAAFSPPVPKTGVRIAGAPPARMTPARARVLDIAAGGLVWPKSELARTAGVSAGVINGLLAAGALAEDVLGAAEPPVLDPDHDRPDLSPAQADATAMLRAAVGTGASVSLLDGVTGSGKTEVYCEAIAEALRQGRQTLVLVPEIALTAQFIQRFEQRFGARPMEWHSDLAGPLRGRTWRAVTEPGPAVVVGARSALFLPFADLGLIVVDEEHDASFKQEERVCYQARDMAVVRGRIASSPVILSSATPSVETLVNANQGRYRHIRLPERFGGAQLPSIAAIDLRAAPPERGRWLSPVLADAVNAVLGRGEQALLFLNRRGYAPITVCGRCGFRFECPDCSAWLVLHRFRRRLECHHCGHGVRPPDACPNCSGVGTLVPCGPGVERIAEEVGARFPEARTVLLSSDLMPNPASLRAVLRQIADGETDIVIGTQLVAKGHNFPKLALVGVVDGDLSLNQSDPRAAERTFQLLNQVTGRAGRGGSTGRGLIQTYMPDHPVIEALVAGDRDAFYAVEIEKREQAGLPPFGRLAAMIVSAKQRDRAETHARALARAAPPAKRIAVLGPAEAPLAVVRARHRYRLLVKAAREVDLQAYLRLWLADAPKPRGDVTVGLDIDPYSFL